MASPAHFYHVFADGEWHVPVHEHFWALRQAGYRGDLFVGMVGTPESCEQVEKYIRKYWGKFDYAAQVTSGFEAVTLGPLREFALQADPDTPVLYCHTKGAFNQELIQDVWRMSMTERLVLPMRERLTELESVDVVGLHWITPEKFRHKGVKTPFFGGNFWWANAGYLATLPPVGGASRYGAEAWIGLGNPRVRDLSPGWPAY